MRKTSTKIFAALALLLAASLALSAGGDEKLGKLKAELNLTDTQVTQLQGQLKGLQPLADRVAALKSELKALRSAASPDQKAVDAKQAEFDTAKKEWKEKRAAAYRTVLTAEQWAKFESMEAHAHKKPHEAKKH